MDKKIQKVLAANSFNLNIDLYFWMIDRGDFTDDQKNQVDIQKQRVRLTREHGQRLENGFYIGKLMHAIRKTIIKKSKKPFTLDPTLSNLKDQNTQNAKDYNWNLVLSELKKFNIKYSKDQKDAIVKESRHGLIVDILQKLQIYDQNLLTFQAPNNNYNSSSVFEKSPNSELNFGNNNLERQSPINNEIESHNDNRSELGSISQNDNKKFLNGAPQKKQLLEPIQQQSTMNEFEQYFDNQSAQDALNVTNHGSSIIQLHQMAIIGNDDLEKSLQFESNNDFDQYNATVGRSTVIQESKPDEINEAETAVLYIFATLKQGFGLRHNQVGGLLSEKNKYLVQMCVKGTKGQDYSKILKWYNLIFNSIGRLIYLLQNELDQVSQTLNVIKTGLFSRDAEVCNLCARVFTKMVSLVNENTQSGPMMEFKHSFWEWLTVQKKQPQASPKKNLELENFQSEQGIKAFLRAQIRHPQDFIEQFGLFLIQVGEDNQIDLFTHHLRINCANNLTYLHLMHDLYDVLCKTQSGKAAFIDSGVLNVLIDMTLQLAGNTVVIRDSGFQSSNSQMLSERTVSMTFLVDVWKYKPDFIQGHGGGMAEQILSVLKKSTRDRSKAVAILAMNQMANLLDSFSRERNKYAPIILKALTFILIDLYLQNDLREEMLHNFINLFKNQPTIPIQIVCEPLFKQIQINIEKQDFIQSNTNILQPNLEMFNLNSTDFLFFMNIAIHPKLNANIAIQLLSIVIEISRKNLIFTRISLKLMLTILNRFENNTAVFEFFQQEIKNNFNTIFQQDQQKIELYKNLMKNPKTKIAAKKRSQATMEIGTQEFSSLASKNTYNIKYKNNVPEVHPVGSSLDKTKGIVSGGGGIGNVEPFLDDSDLQATLDPNVHLDESSHYLKLRTNEKMIINQMQCFLNTGIKVLVDFMREQLLVTYIKIEKKFKFKNKGILYLLQLFNEDVTKMLQFYHTEQQKERAEAIRLKKLQKEQDLAMSRDVTEEDTIPTIRDPYSALNAYHDSINDRDGIFNEPVASLTVKKSNPKYKSSAKSSVRNNVYESMEISRTLDYSIKKSPSRRNNSVQSFESIGTQRKLGEKVGPIRALQIGRRKASEKMVLYDPADYEEEGEKYILWIKQYLKLYKAMFGKYSTISKNKTGLGKKNTFDDMQNSTKFMNLFETFTFLNDFKIMQNYPQIRRDDIKNMISFANLKNSSSAKNTITEIDLEGFIELILQIAHIVSDRLDKASIFLPRFFKYMKDIAMSSNQPMFQRLFDDPHATTIGDQAVIRELTKRVNMDPNYTLPPGFVKFPSQQMVQTFKPSETFPQGKQIALMIIDDIYQSIFGDHYLYPEVNFQQMWGVKPDVFQKQIKQKLKPQYMKIDKRHQFQGRKSSFELEVEQRRETSKLRDIRYSSQPRSDFIKKKTINRKPIQVMESTLEPEIDLTLKVILAENILHPNRNELKESAFILNDMLNAIDNGYDMLSPRTRSKYYQVNNATKSRPLNKYQLDREQREYERFTLEQEKQKKLSAHNAKLKKELEFYHSQKQIKLQEKQRREREVLQMEANERKKQEEQKKAFYDQLKVEFVEQRLPTLQQTSKVDLELKQMSKEKQKQDKINAKKQIEKNAQELSKKFTEQSKKREQDEAIKKKQEEITKKKLADKNLQLASKFKNKDSLRASQVSIPKNTSLSPAILAGNSKINSQVTQKAPTKSVQLLPQINRSTTNIPTQKQLDQMTIEEKQRRITELKKTLAQQNQSSKPPQPAPKQTARASGQNLKQKN